jgi:NADP-dependent 3-hydroxy acid dehydrogenase YdfG
LDENGRMNEIVWVTGASSGIGRATALLLAEGGHPVALSGRRADELDRLSDEIHAAGGRALPVALDVAHSAATLEAVARIELELGPIGAAVFGAGVNVPDRYWGSLRLDEFESVIDTNLTSVARGAAAVLPGMRARGTGQLVVISSVSGWRETPGAGAAYAASKTAVGALVRSINSDEAGNGIRACNLCPGDVDTPILDNRPVVPGAEARERMLVPADIARAVAFVVDSPANVRIDELVITPTAPAL